MLKTLIATQVVLILFQVAIENGSVLAETPKACSIIVKRAQWNSQKSTNVTYQIRPVPWVVIHHTVTPECNELNACKARVRSIQDYHQKVNKWSDIGYNFLIGNTGDVFEGIGWHRVGAHTRRYNSKSIGVAFIGNFERVLPSPKAVHAVAKLMECGVELGELEPDYNLYGARQLIAVSSPGDALYDLLQDWDHYDSSPVLEE
ncbi:peptidoglycan-recognition protein 2-like [Wyeomyia smithii]|uniref:peptidoglycan-recognition protein 2-like n=1 Tax=Wyeomyia smithii TaxID=174621 RepID=UPI002467B854|nr:peptidoglycan-recognition protein 2-like [Wyeomyia smithii]